MIRIPYGLTLVELVVALAVLMIVTSVGVPAFTAWVRRDELAAAVNDFEAHLQLARASALEDNATVVLCTSADQQSCSASATWRNGWIIFRDRDENRTCTDGDNDLSCDTDGGEIIAVHERLSAGLSLTGNHNVAHHVRFNSLGFSPFSNGHFLLCDLSQSAKARRLVLSNSGRIRLVRVSDENACSPD